MFEGTAGIEDRNRHVVAAPRKAGGEDGELTLAAADGEIADEKKNLHGRHDLWSPLPCPALKLGPRRQCGRGIGRSSRAG